MIMLMEILQLDLPNFVIATGRQESVRTFIETSDWLGESNGRDAQVILDVEKITMKLSSKSPCYRPVEVRHC